MRKLTDDDIANIARSTVLSYYVEDVRIKRGKFIDSDHCGIILGISSNKHYVTLEFHIDETEEVRAYWTHHFGRDRGDALHDFRTRDITKYNGAG